MVEADENRANWFHANRSMLLNIYLFINVLGFAGWQGYSLYRSGELDYVDIGFILQNLVLAGVILTRRRHRVFNGNWAHQAVAAVAFFSGIAFMGQPTTAEGGLLITSRIITLTANLLGIATLFNLGRSFGILIAFRAIKTHGLYGIVRHPMYATDILLRIGFVVSHFNPFTIILFILSTGCYIYRAILEERFLAVQPEYRSYMDRVRYRFIPLIF